MNSQTKSYAPSLKLRAAAELELRRRARAASLPTFDAWLPAVSPTLHWQWPHLCHIRAQLEQVTSGVTRRLMIFLPPQHGKSQMTTIRYPVWRLEREPNLRVIVGCYNQTLANTFSRQARSIAKERFALDPERAAVEQWQTTAGGIFRAVGVGGGITGQGGDLVIIDDPVKSREEAESSAYRERVWEWYTQDLYTRLGPQAAIILIMTRWHELDLAGRILESEDGPSWSVVNLPALAEEGDPLGRLPGQALCPERYDEEALAERRTVLGSYGFAALYQQRPAPAEGGMFKREWFDIVGAAPTEARRVRYWDKAGTLDGDYTAGVKLARDNANVYYVEDVVRGQWSALAREQIMRQTAAVDGGDTIIGIEQEPGSGGLESAQNSLRNLAGYVAYADKVTGDKAVRAMPFAAQCEARNVKLVRGSWNGAYLDELVNFPFGAHDDMVDASAGAFMRLALPRGSAMAWQDD